MKRHPKQNLSPIQEKKLHRIGLWLVILAIVLLLFLPEVGLLSLFRQRGELKELRRETEQLLLTNQSIQKENERLQNDPLHLEDIARRDHKLLKPNEEVFDFSNEDEDK